MKTRFRERNLTSIAIIAVAATLLVILATFRVAETTFIAGPRYTAYFSESGGLKTGDPVQVAGVVVGKVKKMELDGNRVKVEFTAKDVDLGDATSARIKTGSLLGARFVELQPSGTSDLDDPIPLARTRAPYDLSSELIGIAGQTKQIDLASVSEALRTFSDVVRPSTEDLGPAMAAVTDLSRTITSRDAAVRELFARASAVTGTFRERTQQITALVRDGSLLLQELELRREVIGRLITDTRGLADQVTLLVRENNRDLAPALRELEITLDVLVNNKNNIRVALSRVSSFVTGLGEGVASGPWFTGRVDLSTGAGVPSTPPRAEDQ
jgi:phospholipid/cholesterol/gamma-HCH transport system substrate-binding protein